MYYQKNSVRNVCRILKVKTQNLKSWCATFYSRMVSGIGSTEKICPANLTLFFQNTKPLYSLTAAFGTVIQTVSMHLFLKPIGSSGFPKYRETSSAIKIRLANSNLWVGESL